MTQLLEIKDKIVRIYGDFEIYINMVLKFLVAFVLFVTINGSIGYMKRLDSMPVTLVLALICSILPQNVIILLAGILVLAHLYALSAETALVGLILLIIIYLLYFRFSPKEGIWALITPVCFKWNIPYIMPVAGGLLRPLSAQLAVICGTVFYYFLHGINQNAALLSAVASTSNEDLETPTGLSVVIGQLTNNKEMFLAVGVFAVTGMVVYLIRRINVDYAWTIAMIAGVLIQMVGFFVGYLFMNVSGKTLWLILGSLSSFVLGMVIQFFAMDLDYARTERVQFEDDEYYYYVKAVPKKMVPVQEKTVKRFGNTASMGKRIDRENEKGFLSGEETSRQAIARELEIDEELLK